MTAQGGLRLRSARGRWVLAASVLGSGMAFLDATALNVALPTIAQELDAGLSGLQWISNAYVLTLAGLLLLGGALGDRGGRRRWFVIGVVWFALASLLCALAPSVEVLVLGRALQGVGAALLTPGSLAILETSFRAEDRGAAIGAWSGLGGIAGAAGPFLGGWLVDTVGWPPIFLLNLPLAAVIVWIALRHVPETRAPAAPGPLDLPGAALAALGLAGVTYALIEGPGRGWDDVSVLAAGAGGVALLTFLLVERRAAAPMLPLELFASRRFSAANAVTFVIYAVLGTNLFLLPIHLQQVLGFSGVQAGLALLPVTVLMLLFSAPAGRLVQRVGPRLPMTLGPLVAAAGLVLLSRVGPDATYLADVLPAVAVFGLGLSFTVGPLTVTVLGAAGDDRAGAASAVNSAVARVAGLIGVAALPALVGLADGNALDPGVFAAGFRSAALVCAGLCAAGGDPRPGHRAAGAGARPGPGRHVGRRLGFPVWGAGHAVPAG